MTAPVAPERRQMLQAAAATALAAMLARPAMAAEAHGDHSQHAGHGAMKPVRTAMLVYPQMVLLDLVGPMTFFSMMHGEMHLVWKDKTPVRTDVGMPVAATSTLKDCPADLDILFVPGGLEGSTALMDDAEVLGFLADRGARAKYVTSVCTGSLVLGAAGLLKGYRATSLWNVRDLLPLMGATVVHDRVVVDRNRITGGGVTAGLDFGLLIAQAIMEPSTPSISSSPWSTTRPLRCRPAPRKRPGRRPASSSSMGGPPPSPPRGPRPRPPAGASDEPPRAEPWGGVAE